tara:strand:- start:184 stop:435 length:252 start_codon:yes stop_codon:yes gene_type:complete
MTDEKDPLPTSMLPEREVVAIQMASEGKTYEQIGDAIGVTRARAYQIMARLRESGFYVHNPREVRQEARKAAREARQAKRVTP